jgi:hypothetical protein
LLITIIRHSLRSAAYAHHALGHQLDAGLGIDDDQRGIDTGQRGDGLPGKIRVARRIDQMNMGVFVAEIDHGRIQGMAGFLLLGVEIATVLPLSTLPLAVMVPVANSSASARLVLPAAPWPTSAMERSASVVYLDIFFSLSNKTTANQRFFSASIISATILSAKCGPSPAIRPPASATSANPAIN